MRPARARAATTVAVTLLIVLSEFAFLTAVYHLDDEADAQRVAHGRVDGAVGAWQPGDATTPVREAVDAFAGTGAPGATALSAAARAWVADPTPASYDALVAADAEAGAAVAAAQRADDVEAALIHATLLVLVSVGWFFWFRTLVRRHRDLQHRLTEREVVDAAERRMLALAQNSTDLVAVLEPDATVSFASPSALSVLGVDAAALAGTALTGLVHEDDLPTFVRVLAGGAGEHPLIVRLRHADGRFLTLEGTVNNLLADDDVRGLVLTVRDVTERQRLQEQLTHQAFHDSLTGLANRQLFRDRLNHALRRRATTPDPLVVLFLDLDDFKNVNDSRGHQVGDELLVAAADRIRRAVREGDTAARLGGDEFAVLMEASDVPTAVEVAERVIAALTEPVTVDGEQHVVRASVGIAEAFPGRSTSQDVLRNADVAMYWAKERGKGTVAVYDASLHGEALERLALRSELQQAIREDQLVLHYQPVVDLDTGRVRGFEALVRWQHPERGLLPPSEFIPVAEQSGLVVPLGSWVLREACRTGARMEHDGDPTMSVNVAAQQIARPDFVAEVEAALRAAGMRADRLVLEITESVILDDLDATVAALDALRGRGVRIAIDDFGTGYSSLSYLSRLPVDVLKVDKSFVDRVGGGSAHETSVVEAIVAMSRTMQLTTVAEGVERHEQADWLRDARCALGQGYLWSRPVALEAALELLAAGTATPVEDPVDPVVLAG